MNIKPINRHSGKSLERVTEEEYEEFLAKFDPKKLQVHYFIRTYDGRTTSLTRNFENLICSRTEDLRFPHCMIIPNEFYINRKILKCAEKLNLLRKPARERKIKVPNATTRKALKEKNLKRISLEQLKKEWKDQR